MKVAVVGSGCSGLAATWLLNEHSTHEIELFEADSRPGGHTNTVNIPSPRSQGKSINVDTGFIVLNPSTYPNFLRFLEARKIETIETDMSFGISRDRGKYEWAGHSLDAVFAQLSNLLNWEQWVLIWDIIRFNTFAIDYLQSKHDVQESIGSYLSHNHYSASFRDNYLLPMTAAIWSTPPDTAALDFPADTLIRFMHNHHLLQVGTRPNWLTVKNGAKTYVDSVLSKLPASALHLDSPVRSVRPRQTQLGQSGGDSGVELEFKDGSKKQFDHVIFACHADTALSILGKNATAREQEVLSEFEFGKNQAVLHWDTALMPQRRKCWSAWNYLTYTDEKTGRANVNKVALTYWMNLLQSIDEKQHGPVLVTLNPPFAPEESKTGGKWDYEHPYMSTKSISAQDKLPSIQNTRGLSFAGAWTKYGFHEDGFTSGLRAALALPDVSCPFKVSPAERDLSEHAPPNWLKLLVGTLQQVFLLLVALYTTSSLASH